MSAEVIIFSFHLDNVICHHVGVNEVLIGKLEVAIFILNEVTVFIQFLSMCNLF